MKNNKGFTLIELLAVIIIIGVLMVISIPGITDYIINARKTVYITNAKNYISMAKTELNKLTWKFFDPDTSYYIHINNLHMDKGGNSPFGDWVDAYVGVTYSDVTGKWTYYWTSVDENGNKVDITEEKVLTEKDIYNSHAVNINNRAPIGTRNKVVIVDRDGNVINTTQRMSKSREEASKCYSYLIDSTNKTVDITYYNIECGKDVMIPAEIDGYKVTAIHEYAFYNMGITSVIIPDTVTSIGARAFMSDPIIYVFLPTGLKTIGSYAFSGCKIPSIELPETLTTISDHAFYNNLISEIKIPKSTTINSCAFCKNPIPNPSFLYAVKKDGTPDYTTVRGYIGDMTEFSDNKFVIPGDVNGVKLTTIASSAFASMPLSGWEVVIPETVTVINSSAFNASGIGKVNLPSGLTTIGGSAFYNNKLTDIRIPDSVTSLGSLAFNINQTTDPEQMWIYKRTSKGIDYSTIVGYSGKNRKNIEIPKTKNGVELTTIAESAFRYLSLTGTITIPDTVTSIGQLAFALNKLTSIINVDGVNDGPFVYKVVGKKQVDRTYLLQYAAQSTKHVDIPTTVKIIAPYAFYYSYIYDVTIPEGVTEIGNYAFQLCHLGDTVVIPSTVTSIGTQAFSKVVNWAKQNHELTKIVNKTGRSFDWKKITNGPSPATFKYGTVENWYGDIEVVASEDE